MRQEVIRSRCGNCRCRLSWVPSAVLRRKFLASANCSAVIRNRRRIQGKRSPSEFVRFFRSRYLSFMDEWATDLRARRMPFPPGMQPDDPSAMEQCLSRAGLAHEQRILEHFYEIGADVVSVKPGPDAVRETRQHIIDGREVIHQAALTDSILYGYADFLLRDLGNWSAVIEGNLTLEEARKRSAGFPARYAVCESKLSNDPRAYHLMQAACYVHMLQRTHHRSLNSVELPGIYLWMGRDSRPTYFRYDEIRHIFEKTLRDYRSFLSQPPNPGSDIPEVDLSLDDISPWKEATKTLLRNRDSLLQVASIRTSHVACLKSKGGILTMTDLARAPQLPELSKQIGIPRSTLLKLQRQAELQCDTNERSARGADDVIPSYEVIVSETRGLARLPRRSDLDVYFDIESDPLQSPRLEYLLGVVDQFDNSLTWWSHDTCDEIRNFGQFVEWIWNRYHEDVGTHVYHYGSYEQSTLERMEGWGTLGAETTSKLSKLLDAGVFIDVYKIVREGIILGMESYSIKNVEKLCGIHRSEQDIVDATSSVAMYGEWLVGGRKDQSILSAIAKYNQQDCESLRAVVSWLRSQQLKHGIESSGLEKLNSLVSVGVPGKESSSGFGSPVAIGPGVDQLAEGCCGGSLQAKIADTAIIRRLDDLARRLEKAGAERPECLASSRLVGFHLRESKVERRHFAARVSREGNEDEDDEVIYTTWNLQRRDHDSASWTYNFDSQSRVRIGVGSLVALIDAPGNLAGFGTVTSLQPGTIELRLSRELYPPQNPSLVLCNHLRYCAAPMRKSLLEFGHELLEGLDESAVARFLRRQPAVFDSTISHAVPDVIRGSDTIFQKVVQLSSSVMVIQGGPGSGKTSLASRIIASLVELGFTIAVSSNSHLSIDNLLNKVAATGISDIVKVGGDPKPNGEYRRASSMNNLIIQRKSLKKVSRDKQPAGIGQVVGATVYQLSTCAPETFDYLFVDEAGQVSLANFVAMGRCARNAVLLGDHQQLEMPLQGSHDTISGRSALGFLVGPDVSIVPPEFGIFLSKTYRLPPSLCRFVSSSLYDGILRNSGACMKHRVELGPSPLLVTKKSGILCIPTEGDGDQRKSRVSVAEAQQAVNIVNELIGREFVTSSERGILTGNHILVVAPFNAQVDLLKAMLGSRARVGTVDKFQGQEAPVVVISLCGTEIAEDDVSASSDRRGTEFVLHRNRLNVALTRAQCLAIVVAHQSLRRSRITCLDDLFRMNFLCRLWQIGCPDKPIAPRNLD